MKKKLLTAIFGGMLVLAACGGGDDGGNGGGEESASGGGDTGQGEELYQQNCASCHGGDLSGGAGPALEGVGDSYDASEIVDIIQNGKGSMPAQNVEEGDAQEIADWLVQQ
ncbi:cytochrome c551 [Allobacillus sp. GCM10007491]|uniref:Cytochrome c n=2 Tax=Allobacillus TaxID=1400133 RepID=A0A941HRT2_9BACI|nr:MULTISPECIES: cytochrome c [Allobacillus]MBR7552698.1 cytochrome c [Allobacillus saliphilus]TSJ66789.1 cytochrome c [Allobacillus salarius]